LILIAMEWQKYFPRKRQEITRLRCHGIKAMNLGVGVATILITLTLMLMYIASTIMELARKKKDRSRL